MGVPEQQATILQPNESGAPRRTMQLRLVPLKMRSPLRLARLILQLVGLLVQGSLLD
jgi:hypothetical protein